MPVFEKLYENTLIRAAFIAILALAAAVSLYQGIGNARRFSQDFQWDAAKALCIGLDPYELSMHPEKCEDVPELAAFYAMFTDQGLKQKMEANQFPSLLLLLAPMTAFLPETAKNVWLVLNLVFTAGIILLLRKTFFEDTPGFVYAAGVLITLAGTPYRNQLGVGQHTLFAFFFFMLAVWLEEKRPVNRVACGVLTAFSLFVSFFKYTLTAPLAIWFIYRRRYRELAAAVMGHVVLTVVCAMYLGKSVVYMIKAPLQVASALAAEGGIDLGVMLPGYAAYAVALVIVIMLCVIVIRTGPGYDRPVLSMLILWSLILTYHRTYDFFVLSAAAMMFTAKSGEKEDMCFGKKCFSWYALLVVIIFFVLRIFNENTASRICAGIVYYAFTVYVTIVCAVSGAHVMGAGEKNR